MARDSTSKKTSKGQGRPASRSKQGDLKSRVERPSEARQPGLQIPSLGPGNQAPLAIGAKGARTVVYVHGIGNKPEQAVLKCQWDTALFGHAMGDRTRLAYWVNREYYPTPEDATCATPDHVRVDDDEISTRAIMALARGERGDEREAIAREIEALAQNPRQKDALERIAARLLERGGDTVQSSAPGSVGARILPFEWLRRFIAPKLTRAFLRDVNDFLYAEDRRKAMEQSVIDRLAAGGGPFVVVGHSQGSMVAYDVLRQLDPRRFEVALFVTIGSPLGIEEVQDELQDWDGGRLAFPPCVRRWVNVADPTDVVAVDPTLSGEFTGGTIQDIVQKNPDAPEHPHSGTGYLQHGAGPAGGAGCRRHGIRPDRGPVRGGERSGQGAREWPAAGSAHGADPVGRRSARRSGERAGSAGGWRIGPDENCRDAAAARSGRERG